MKGSLKKIETKIVDSRWKDTLHSISDWPRKENVGFRLATGHDCLARYLNRIDVLRSPAYDSVVLQ